MEPIVMTTTEHLNICKEYFEVRKKATSQAAKNAKIELQNLIQTANIPETLLLSAKPGSPANFEMPEDPGELADVKKLLFLNTQVSLAESIITSLFAQCAAWERRDFLNTPTDDEEQLRIAYYQKANELLRIMELSFKEVLCVDSKFFGPIWKASLNIIKTYPERCLGAVGAAGLLGALAGSGLVPLHIGFRALLTCVFGEATALSGALAGGVLGVIVAGAIVAIIALRQRRQRTETDVEAEDLRLMKQRIARIAGQDLNLAQGDLIQLENLFDKAFRDPLRLARDDEHCPVCLDHFVANGGSNAERAIKAPNCQGNHMVHRKCLQDWHRESGCGACIICRQ